MSAKKRSKNKGKRKKGNPVLRAHEREMPAAKKTAQACDRPCVQFLGSLVSAAVLSLFVVLLAYKAALLCYAYNPQQRAVVNFLREGTALPPGFRAAEVNHLYDVAQLMQRADYLFWITCILAAASVSICVRRRNWLSTGRQMVQSALLSLALLAAGGLGMLLFFVPLFRFFHRIFFPQGNWQFSHTDKLIMLFQRAFFRDFALSMALMALIVLLAVLIAGLLVKRQRE